MVSGHDRPASRVESSATAKAKAGQENRAQVRPMKRFDVVLLLVVVAVCAVAAWYLYRHPEVAEWDQSPAMRER